MGAGTPSFAAYAPLACSELCAAFPEVLMPPNDGDAATSIRTDATLNWLNHLDVHINSSGPLKKLY